jgi:hypothetical protein
MPARIEAWIDRLYSFERTATPFRSTLVLALLLIAVLSIRWNGHDPDALMSVTENSSIYRSGHDISNYIRLVESFRGDQPEQVISQPFRYRISAALLPSIIPTDPLTALNIINVLFHLRSIICLISILGHYRFTPFEQITGVFIYICSYPMVFYGAVGWNDPFL